jgi:DNA invertase Pin-like site-specific DNA recombinase
MTKDKKPKRLAIYDSEPKAQEALDISTLKNVTILKWEHTPECEIKGCLIAASNIRQSKGETESIEAQIGSESRWIEKAERNTGKIIHLAYRCTDKTGAWTQDGPPPRRPGWESLNKLVDHKKIDITLCREISRYSRIKLELLQFLERCRLKDIYVHSQSEVEGDCASEDNIGTVMTIFVKVVLNSHESKQIGDRIRENTVELKQCGFWLGGMHTGYFPKGGEYRENVDSYGNQIKELFVPRFPRKHENGQTYNGKILEPVPNWKEAVNEAATEILTGGNLRSAGKKFQKYGFKVDCKGIIESGKIRSWLSSPILIGYLSADSDNRLTRTRSESGLEKLKYVQKDSNGNPVAGVEPVMEYQRWINLQHALNSIRDQRSPKTPFLLQGLLTCERCGHNMTRAIRPVNGKDLSNYICLKTKTMECKGVTISMNSLDKYIEQKVFKKFNKKEIEASAIAYEEEQEKLMQSLPEAHTQELIDLNKKYDILQDMLLEETSATARKKMKEKLDEIAKKIDDTQTYKIAEPKTPSISVVLDGANVKCWELENIWHTFTTQQKTAIIRSVTDGILIKQVGHDPYRRPHKGRFFFDETRIVIWWRGEERPKEWDLKHPNIVRLENNQEAEQV